MKSTIRNTLTLSLLIALLAPAGIVLADGHKSAEQKDRAHDGPFTEEERAAMHARMKAHRKEMAGRHLDKLDTNDDGKVDLSEFLADAERRFTEMDGDGDGYVTAEEAQSKHRELRKQRMERNKMRHKKRMERMEEEAPADENAS